MVPPLYTVTIVVPGGAIRSRVNAAVVDIHGNVGILSKAAYDDTQSIVLISIIVIP
jgi:hypothetical protein